MSRSTASAAKVVAAVLGLAILLLLAFNMYLAPHGGTSDVPQAGRASERHRQGLQIDGASGISAGGFLGGHPLTITVDYNGQSAIIRLMSSSSEESVKEAISAATGLPPGSFTLRTGDGVIVTPAADLFVDQATYIAVLLARKCPSSVTSPPALLASDTKQKCLVPARGSDDGLQLSPMPVKVPRVVITSLGTGEYRAMAIEALETALKYFGGDCIPSLHLLTDDIAGVDPVFNARHTAYREWPESGLLKFEDIKNALYDVIKGADYFFFLDADVRFNEPVALVDVGADLVAVEHPMYPRFHFGWCVPGDRSTSGFCIYPYDRNEKVGTLHTSVPCGGLEAHFYFLCLLLRAMPISQIPMAALSRRQSTCSATVTTCNRLFGAARAVLSLRRWMS